MLVNTASGVALRTSSGLYKAFSRMRFVPAAKEHEGLSPYFASKALLLGIAESGIGKPAAVNGTSAPAAFHIQRGIDDQ